MAADLVGVTIAIGETHRRLAAEAAARMGRLAGVAVRVLGEAELRACGLSNPNHLKFRLFDLVDAADVLYFDADAWCLRGWDPRPLAGGAWTAVRGFWFDPRVQRLGRLYGFGAETFNGGLFLCNRERHHRVLRLAEALQPPDNTFHGLVNDDEIALSTALHVLRVPVRWLDRRYNWIGYGRGGLAADAGVVVAHACHPELRRAYLAGAAPADERAPAGPVAFAPFAGKTYLYHRVGFDRRPIAFRADGTVGTGGGDAERYYYVRPGDAGPELVVGSADDVTCVLAPDPDGVWRGAWTGHERMPVRLERHRGQVLLDLLAGRAGDELVGVEVGVDQGETSRLLLAGLPRLRLYLVDPWHAAAPDAFRRQADCDAAMAAAAEATAFAEHRRFLVPCPHQRAVGLLPAAPDLVFLDADHGHEATREAIALWWPRLAAGGLLAGHDYGHPDYPGVRPAVDEFARAHRLQVRTADDGVWYFRRD